VKVNGIIIEKNHFPVDDTDHVETDIEEIAYVSRSALKLKWFLQQHSIDIKNSICLDVGSSTGGFTQVLLEYGAKKVYAVDVGTQQLHSSLRENENIVSMEQTDIRSLTRANFSENIEIIVWDVSFVPLAEIIDSILACGSEKTKYILLLKPQFEVTKSELSSSGVVKDTRILSRVLADAFAVVSSRWVENITSSESMLPGEKGNREVFLYFQK